MPSSPASATTASASAASSNTSTAGVEAKRACSLSPSEQIRHERRGVPEARRLDEADLDRVLEELREPAAARARILEPEASELALAQHGIDGQHAAVLAVAREHRQ